MSVILSRGDNRVGGVSSDAVLRSEYAKRMTAPGQAVLRRHGAGQSLADQVKALFANGEQGAWYDPSDFSTMFQDSAGTIPVTAVEQPVGLMLDKSGRGNHASQPSAASRPVLQSIGGKLALVFDGVDDFLSTGSIDFTSTDKMTVVAGYVAPSTALGMFLELSGNGNATDGAFYITDNEAVSGLGTYRNRGTTLAHEANLLSPTPDSGVITVRFDNGAALADQARIRINGADAPVVNGAATLAGNFGNHPLYIGSRAGTAFFFNGHLYSLVVRGAMTADLAPVETYVADKTGVTLP